MDKAYRIAATVAVALILVLVGVVGGLFIAGNSNAAKASFPVVNQTSGAQQNVDDQLNEVMDYLDREALNPPSETSMTAGAIKGLLEASGDKYATYFDPKHYKFFKEQTMGAFGGIGVSLGENKEGQAYVVEVYPDTPASKAGIKAGDVFYKIEKVSRDKWTTEEVVKRVRGEEGTKVTVEMKRKGSKKPLSFTMTRAMIEYPNTMAKKYGDIGYIRMQSFNAKSAEELTREIQSLEKQGVKGLVLDLRDNPGGLLSSAVDVTSLFIKDGNVVSVEERGKEPEQYRATGKKITDLPLAVLINENSASASEITAGALQDYGRAVLIGAKSFGKGSVQTVRDLASGGAIKFTTAHYLTPKDRAINGKGLQPDVKVPMKAELQADRKTDVQLQKAIDYLESKF